MLFITTPSLRVVSVRSHPTCIPPRMHHSTFSRRTLLHLLPFLLPLPTTAATPQQQQQQSPPPVTRLTGESASLFTRARRAASQSDFELALSLYNQLQVLSPTFPAVYSNRANILVTLQDYKSALSDYDTALSLSPSDSERWVIYTNRGSVYLTLNRSQEALNDLNTAHDLRGDEPIVLMNRAAVYEKLQKWDAAIRDYQQALRSSEVLPFWLRYALVLLQRNRLNDSLAILRRVEIKFNVDDVHAALAVVLFEKGDLAQAEDQWRLVQRPRVWEKDAFLEERLWPPRAREVMKTFRGGT